MSDNPSRCEVEVPNLRGELPLRCRRETNHPGEHDFDQPAFFTADKQYAPEAERERVADNWAHRTAGMRCSSCMWFVRKQGAQGIIIKTSVGRCRRHAPTMSGWPVMFDTDWCGDHKLDENKA